MDMGHDHLTNLAYSFGGTYTSSGIRRGGILSFLKSRIVSKSVILRFAVRLNFLNCSTKDTLYSLVGELLTVFDDEFEKFFYALISGLVGELGVLSCSPTPIRLI